MFLLAAAAFHLCLLPAQHSLEDVANLEPTTPAITRVYLVRHGESLFNVPDEKGIKYTSGKSLSIPLTEKGKREAENLGRQLAEKLPRNQSYIISSSTARRALETAVCIFNELKQSHLIEWGSAYEELCELGQGVWEGQPKDAAFDREVAAWDKLSAKEKFCTPKLSTGESFEEVAARMELGVEQMIGGHRGKTIIAVSHFAAMNALNLQLCGGIDSLSEELATPLPLIHFKNCSILQLELEDTHSIEEARIIQHLFPAELGIEKTL